MVLACCETYLGKSGIEHKLTEDCTGTQNAYLVKRPGYGGVQFSSDPFNLTNKHSRKYAGFVNDKVGHVDRPRPLEAIAEQHARPLASTQIRQTL